MRQEVQKSKKDKTVAAIIAFFLGMFGIHRFYLGQIGLGILYAVLSFTGITTIIGIIDAIVLLAMDKDKFNFKYNRDYFKMIQREERQISIQEQEAKPPVERYQRQQQKRKEQAKLKSKQRAALKKHKENGIAHFKEYDFKAAIADFTKALEIAPNDPSVHFNIACAYSLSEHVDKALYHLDTAVANGFDDFSRIKTHDALAYVRIQAAYDEFEANKFRLPSKVRTIPVQKAKEKVKKIDAPKTNLLEQLKQLGDLRERGILTDEQFIKEKQRLFG